MASKAFKTCFGNLAGVKNANGNTLTPEEITRLQAAFTRAVQSTRATGVPIQQAILGANVPAIAALKKDIGQQQYKLAQEILAFQNTEATIAAHSGQHDGAADTLGRMLMFSSDGRSNFRSVTSRSRGIYQRATIVLSKLQRETKGRMFGFINDPAKEAALISEIDGIPSGNAEMSRVAKAWGKLTDELVGMLKAKGWDIGKLGDIYRPQMDDNIKIARTTDAEWLNDVTPLVDTANFYRDELGNPISPAQLRETLLKIRETKATEGANKPTAPGGGGFTGKLEQKRELHLKSDGQAWLTYMRKYGAGNMIEQMDSHIHRLSKTLALADVFGPNPEKVITASLNAERERLGGNIEALNKFAGQESDVMAMLDDLTSGGRKYSPGVARFERINRSFQMLKLGFSALTNYGDNATMQNMAHLNGVSGMGLFIKQLQKLNPLDRSERKLLENAGLMTDAVSRYAMEFGDKLSRGKWYENVGEWQYKITGAMWQQQMRRASFGQMMMNNIGDMTRTMDYAALASKDRQMLTKNGVTEQEWNVWRLAAPVDWRWGRGSTMLTPETIYAIPDPALAGMGNPATLRSKAAMALLSAVHDETYLAVYEPTDRSRSAMLSWASKAERPNALGQGIGLLARSMLQFKSFPLGFIGDMVNRSKVYGAWSKRAAWLGSLAVGLTLIGAGALQAGAVLRGRNPRDMTDPKFWGAALMKGGAFGVFGDFLFQDTNDYAGAIASAVAGPTISDIGKVLNIGAKSVGAQGQPGDWGRVGSDSVDFLKAKIPTVPVWYLNTFYDRLFFQQLQEAINPGFNARIQQGAAARYHQGFWWRPGQAAPQDTPDLDAAVGQ